MMPHLPITLALALSVLAAPPPAGAPGAARVHPLPLATQREARVARPLPAPPLGPEERALAAVEEAARTAVTERAKLLASLPDGPARHALQREIVEIKLHARVEFLRVKSDFARRRGDLAAAREAEAMIERFLHPEATVPAVREASPAKPAPLTPAKTPVPREGGRP